MLAILVAILLAQMGPRPAPVLLGPAAAPAAYASVPIAGLMPLRPEEVRAVLMRRSRPARARVPDWYRRNDANLPLSFTRDGRAVDGGCDPAACEGRYTITRNSVALNFVRLRGGPVLHFYMAANGTVYAVDDRMPNDGRASPW